MCVIFNLCEYKVNESCLITLSALAGKKEFDKETVMKTRKTEMRNSRTNLRMCPWSEQGEMEGPSGGKDGNVKQAEEEMEDEELEGHSYESHQPWYFCVCLISRSIAAFILKMC